MRKAMKDFLYDHYTQNKCIIYYRSLLMFLFSSFVSKSLPIYGLNIQSIVKKNKHIRKWM